MKKVLMIMLTLCMVTNLVACSSKEAVDGGWSNVEEKEITPELKEKFLKASEGYEGMKLVPIELLKTQIVAGVKYKILCDGTVVVPNGETKKVIVTILEDLDGNVEILSVEDYKE